MSSSRKLFVFFSIESAASLFELAVVGCASELSVTECAAEMCTSEKRCFSLEATSSLISFNVVRGLRDLMLRLAS